MADDDNVVRHIRREKHRFWVGLHPVAAIYRVLGETVLLRACFFVRRGY